MGLFTATQIPDIAGRRYPRSLAGPRYPEGIPIYPEEELGALIAQHQVDDVVFSYSDVANQTVMAIAQMVIAAGANFRLLGADARTFVTVTALVRCSISSCNPRRSAAKSEAV